VYKWLFNIAVEIDQSILFMNNNHYHRFKGPNAFVAITVFRNNQEDSVIFNGTSIENASFTSIKYQYISYNIKDNILIDINLYYEN